MGKRSWLSPEDADWLAKVIAAFVVLGLLGWLISAMGPCGSGGGGYSPLA